MPTSRICSIFTIRPKGHRIKRLWWIHSRWRLLYLGLHVCRVHNLRKKKIRMHLHYPGSFQRPQLQFWETSLNTVNEAMGLATEVKTQHECAGFELRPRLPNSGCWSFFFLSQTVSRSFEEINQRKCLAKSIVSPLGLVSNFLVHGNIVLQEVWRVSVYSIPE